MVHRPPKFFHIAGRGCILLLLFAVCSCRREHLALSPQEAGRRLIALEQTVAEDFLQHNNEIGLLLGDPRYVDRWSNPSDEEQHRRQKKCQQWSAELSQLLPLLQREKQKQAATWLQLWVKQQRIAAQVPYNRLSLDPELGPHKILSILLWRFLPRAGDPELRSTIKRLQHFPTYVEQQTALLQQRLKHKDPPPRSLLRRMAADLSADASETSRLAQLFRSEANMKPQQQQEFDAAVEQSQQALARLLAFLERVAAADNSDRGLAALDSSGELYRAMLCTNIGRCIEPQEIYDQAFARLGQLQTQTRALMLQNGAQDLQKFAQSLVATDRSMDLVLAKQHSQELQAEIGNYFPGVQLTMEWQQLDHRDWDFPGLIRVWRAINGKPTLVQLAPVDGTYSQLALFPSLAAAIVPGQMLATAAYHQAQQPPTWRRLLGQMQLAYWQGWAQHAANIPLGPLTKNSAKKRLGVLSFNAVTAAKAAVDVGMHGLQLNRNQALAILRGQTLLTSSEAQRELDFILARPATAAAAFVGANDFQQLAAATQKRLQSQEQLFAFYAGLLAEGPQTRQGLLTSAQRYHRLQKRISQVPEQERTQEDKGQ